MYQSVTQGIVVCHMESIPEYWSATEKNQDLQVTLYIGVSVSNPCYSGLSLKVYTEILVGDKVNKDLSATLYPKVSVCNLGYSSLSPGQNVSQRQSIVRSVSYTVPRYSGQSPGVHTKIPVSDKKYEYLSATLLPSILVWNLGYSGLSPGVYTGILVNDKVYEDL